jgi:hypothetical protein
LPQTREPQLQRYAQQLQGSITNLNSQDESEDGDAADEEQSGEDDSTISTGPFIGVASRNRSKSVINYYGIDRHDRWVFTPLFR